MSDSTILFSFCAMLIVPCLVAWDSAAEKKGKGKKVVGAEMPIKPRETVSNASMQRRREALKSLEIPEFVGA